MRGTANCLRYFQQSTHKSELFPFPSFRLESDPEDLEELLRGGLVPWVRQKLRGKAPPEVCRWLLRLVGGHDVVTVVIAAEEALLQLLAEDCKVRDGRGHSQYIECLILAR